MCFNTKKIISVLLTIAMVFSIVSVPVFAEEDVDSASETAFIYDDAKADGGITVTEGAAADTEYSDAWPSEGEESSDDSTAEGNEVTYSISEGETYSFTNIGNTAYNLTDLNGARVDYIIYNNDGSISTYKCDEYVWELSVPAGGEMLVTLVSESRNITLSNSQIIAEMKDDPVMERKVMLPGDGYVFENISNNAYSLCINNYFDYVLYDTVGNIVECETETYLQDKSISAGYKIKLVLTGYEATVGALYDKFIVEDADTPPIRRIITYPGESYIIKNVSKKEYQIKNLDSIYDYVMYDAEGNIAEYETRDTASLYNKSIPAGYSLKITEVGEYRTDSLCVLYDEFSVEKSDIPVMDRINIYPGETYTLKNITNTEYILKGGIKNIDYVLYNADGGIEDYEFGAYLDNTAIPAGYSIKFTSLQASTGNNMSSISILHDKFSIEKEAIPVATKMSVYRGEAYTITNISDEDCLLDGLTIYADYVIYDAEGSITEYGSDSYMSKKTLPSGCSIDISYINRDNSEISVLNEQCTISKCDKQPMLRVYAQEGEKYKFTNISSEPKSINFGYHNYELYNSDGTLSKTGTEISDLEIPSGGYIIVWTENSSYYFKAVSEWFSVEAVTPAYNYLYCTYGQTYKFENTSNVDKKIDLEGYQSWDYMVFDANGLLTSYDLNSIDGASTSSEKITLSSGAVAYVTPFTSQYNSIIINEGITVTPYENEVDIDKHCTPGQVYKLTNIGTRTQNVEADTESADYIIYNSDGSVKEYENNSYKYHFSDYSSDYAYQVPANGWLLISSESFMRLSCLSEYFEIEEVDGKLFTTTVIEDGKTFSFQNVYSTDSTISINGKLYNGSSCNYDYVIYNADGSVYDEGVYCTYDITVPTKCTIVITACVGNPIIKTLTDVFVISERNYPVFKKSDIYISNETRFTNTSKSDRTLHLFTGGYVVDYVTYNAAGDVVKAEKGEYKESITVPANGSAEVRGLLSNFVAAGLYESFSDEDVSVHPTGVTLSETDLKLKVGEQKVLKAIVTPDNATNKSVVWSTSDKNIVTVTQTGKISTKAAGNATITVTTEDGGKTAVCNVTVADDDVPSIINVTGVSLDKSAVSMDIGTTIALTAAVLPANATNKNVSWSSSDTNVAIVSNGVVTAKSAGSADITATTEDGSKTAVCNVTVNAEAPSVVAVTGVSLDKSAISMDIGKKATLAATVLPANATNKNVSWSSSDTNVATVSNGVVTAKTSGSTVITVTTADGSKTAICTVTVKEKVVDENAPRISISEMKVRPGFEATLTVDLTNNTGFAALGIEVGYDKDVMTLVSAEDNRGVGGNFTPAQTLDVNPYNMGWDSARNILYNGNLATLTFKINENAPDGIYPITLDYYKGVKGDYVDGDSINYDENFDAVGFVYVSGGVIVANYIPGDINGDETIDNKDATFLLRYLAGWSLELVDDALDVDGSGIINNKDATILLRYLAGWDVELH